jgi:hypothetical protein
VGNSQAHGIPSIVVLLVVWASRLLHSIKSDTAS